MTLRWSLGQRSRSAIDDPKNPVNAVTSVPLKGFQPDLTKTLPTRRRHPRRLPVEFYIKLKHDSLTVRRADTAELTTAVISVARSLLDEYSPSL